METVWSFIINMFINATRTSYKKALKLSNYHDSALATASANDPAILLIYNRYHPLHIQFINKYNEWVSAGGSQEGRVIPRWRRSRT